MRNAGRIWRRTGWLVAFALLVAVAPARGEAIVLSGLVKAGDRSLGGATVELLPLPGEPMEARLWLSGKLTPDPLAKVVSDARGAFAVSVSEPGHYRLRVAAPGRVPMEITLRGVVESMDLPIAVLPTEQRLTLAVRSGGGPPIPEAWVRLLPARQSAAPWGDATWRVVERRGKTGANGEVQLPRIAGESLEVEVFKSGYLPVDRELRSSSRVEVLLEAAPWVPMIVTGPDRAVRPGAVALVGAAKWPLDPADGEGRLLVPAAGKRSLELVVRTEAGERVAMALPSGPAADGTPRRVMLAPPRAITGRVVSSGDRAPVAGAVVWGLSPDEAGRSDRSGTYRLIALSQEVLFLNVAAPGYRPGRLDATLLVGDSETGPMFALERAASLLGRVVDGSGHPLSEVEITATAAPLRRNSSIMRNGLPVRGRTALDGSFRLHGVAADAKVEIRAVHPEFAPWREEVASLSAGANPPKRIVLERGRIALGRVQDAEERAVAGATVDLFEATEGREPWPWKKEDPLASGTTDGTGKFALTRIAAGRYDLRVRARGFAPLRVPGLEFVPDSESRDLGVVTLGPGAVLDGRVVDATGKAVEGAALSVEAVSSSRALGRFFGEKESPNLYSAADGWFRFEDLEPGRPVTILAEAAGLGTTVLNRVAVPRNEPLVLVLSPLGAVAGRVTTSDGKPVAGALVAVSVERTIGGAGGLIGHRASGEPVRTGEDGQFRVDQVEAGEVSIGAGGEGYASASTSLALAPGQVVEDVEIVLWPGARVVGRVLGPDGEPREGVMVMGGQGSVENSISMSDGEGRFSLEGVPLGRCRLTAMDRELGQVATEVDVVAGENRAELRFTVRGEVAGRVLRADGAPLGQATVDLRRVGGGSRGSRTAVTSPDGSFRFAALAEGLYELAASAEGYAAARLPEPIRVLSAPVAGLELRLGSGGTVRGRVLGLDLAEMPKVRLQATASVGRTWRTATLDYSGQFRFEHLAVGEWLVSATHSEDSRSTQREVTISGEGAEVEINLELPTGIRFTGRVVRNGSPVRDVMVELRARERQLARHQTTDADGLFAFAGLSAGTYDFVVRSRGAQLHEEELALDGDREITVELPGAAGLSGHTVDVADQRPVADAWLILTSAGDNSSNRGSGESYAHSDGGGRFHFAGLTPGAYRLRIERGGYETLERTIEIDERPAADPLVVELVAAAGLTLEVRSASGGIPDAVRVALRAPDGRLISASVSNPDELGRVRLGSAPRGSWELLVQSDDSALLRTAVVAPGGPFSVVLPAGAALDVVVPALAGDDTWVPLRVVDAQGRPFEALSGTQLRGEWRLSRGRARLVGLSPGAWTVAATLPAGGELAASVNAVAGALTTVTLE